MSVETGNAKLAKALDQLLEPAQIQEVSGQLTTRWPDPRQLLRELQRRGWLTSFQAELLIQGKEEELLLGPYVLLERLGEGGFCQVFKARHRAMQRLVALKVLRKELGADADTLQRFLREMQVASQLSHPHIVRAYEAGPIGETLVLVLEYVKGVDLQQLVDQSGRLPWPQAADYIRQAALGLQHAHEKGLVHRDIKPGNLLLAHSSPQANGPGQIKLLDLGLARLQQPPADSKTHNLTVVAGTSVMLGTPDYMAPEQALDLHSADIRADIYSLGCTLYFLLAGQPPFGSGSLAEKLMKHQQAEPRAIQEIRPDLPAKLSLIAQKMLAKRPGDRYQTPGEVARALAELLDAGTRTNAKAGAGFAPQSAGKPRRQGEPAKLDRPVIERSFALPPVTRRRFLLFALGAVVLLVGLAMAGAWLFKDQPTSRGPSPTTGSLAKGRGSEGAEPTALAPLSVAPAFLADLPEMEVKVGFGQFGKKGHLGYANNKSFTVNGVPSPNGLSMHPPAGGSARVLYALGGKYRTFTATAAITDDADSRSPLTFRVLADSKEIWKSRPLKQQGETDSCSVGIGSVDRLELEVRCPGRAANANAVWLEPEVRP
jgi:serine/threonine protein kinase